MSILKKNTAERRKKNADEPIGCLSLFGLVWMLIVLGIDGFFVHSAYRMMDARERYQQAPGVVLRSYVESHSDSDGTTYSPFVEYEYEVDGRTHRGNRDSMFQFSSSSRGTASEVVDRYPEGKRVEVFYDPDDHAESVLDLSDRSVPYFIILFLTPFHCIGLGFMSGGVVNLRRWIKHKEDRPVAQYIVRGDRQSMVLRDAHWAGYGVFFMVTGVCSFVAIFAIGIVSGFSLSRDAALMAVGGCVGAGILVPTLMRLKRAGKHDTLRIDWQAVRFTREPESINIDIGDIKTIRLTVQSTNTTVNKRPWYKHTVSGVDAQGGEHKLLVAKGFREKGESVRDWFAERFEAAAEEGDLPEEPSPSMSVSEVEINRTNS
ncbi:MAG: DUF3592 domain-containing protein [bacterium]|nr:DUF3592 domain-containing protein [bacterium]